MKANTYLWGCLTIGLLSNAFPVHRIGSMSKDLELQEFCQLTIATVLHKRAETADGDDQVVYTWSLPEDKIKRAETADGDDQVVYTWSLSEETGIKG